MATTRKEYEGYLNDMYSIGMKPEAAFNELVHLTVASRGKHTTEARLRAAIQNGTAGTLVRKLDPIGFTAGLNSYEAGE